MQNGESNVVRYPQVNEIWKTGKNNNILFTFADGKRFYGIYDSGKCAILTRADFGAGKYRFVRRNAIDFQKLFKDGKLLSILGKIA